MTAKHFFICGLATIAGLTIGYAVYPHVGRTGGNLSTRDIHVSDFQEFAISVPCTIIYVQDPDSPAITITATDEVWDMLKVSSEDGKAEVKSKKSSWQNLWSIEIRANSSSLSKLSCAGSVDFSSDAIDTKSFEAIVSGHGDIQIEKITTESFDVKVSGSGDIDASGAFGETSVKVAGSGDVDLDGEFGDITLSISGSGKIDLSGKAGDVNAKIAGSGDIDLTKLEFGHIASSIGGSGKIKS